MILIHNKVVQFLVLIISLGLCLSSIGTIVDLLHRKDVIVVRQQDLSAITRENQKLEQQLKETQSQDYVERIARDKLGFVKDGESIILLPQPQNGSSQDGRGATALTNWQRWLKLFF